MTENERNEFDDWEQGLGRETMKKCMKQFERKYAMEEAMKGYRITAENYIKSTKILIMDRMKF
jgi:hypothetical protein